MFLFYVGLTLTRATDICAAGFINNCANSPLLSQETVRGQPAVEIGTS